MASSSSSSSFPVKKSAGSASSSGNGNANSSVKEAGTINSRPQQVLKFIHITKCAGTTVEMVCKSQGMLCGKFDNDYEDAVKRMPPPWPLAWWHVAPQSMYPPALAALLEHHVFFVVVRNPFSRLISEFYCEWSGDCPQERRGYDRAQFNAYLRRRLVKLRADLADPSAGLIQGHYVPQYLYLVRPATSPSSSSVRRKIAALNPVAVGLVCAHMLGWELLCPHILHIESFAVEFNALMRKYNCAVRVPGDSSDEIVVGSSTSATAGGGDEIVVGSSTSATADSSDEIVVGSSTSATAGGGDEIVVGSSTSVTAGGGGAAGSFIRISGSGSSSGSGSNISTAPSAKLKYNECGVAKLQRWCSGDLDESTRALVREVYSFDFLLGGYDADAKGGGERS